MWFFRDSMHLILMYCPHGLIYRRHSMMLQNRFAMIPIRWCARFIHVLSGHKVCCHYHHTRQSESWSNFIRSTLNDYKTQKVVAFLMTYFTEKVRKTLWSWFICGSSRVTTHKHHLQRHRFVQSKQVYRYVQNILYST